MEKAKEFIINCYGIFWIYEDEQVLWLSKEGNISCNYEKLPTEVKEFLGEEKSVIWESKNIKLVE